MAFKTSDSGVWTDVMSETGGNPSVMASKVLTFASSC